MVTFTFFSGYDRETKQVYGTLISTVTQTATGSSVAVALPALPGGQGVVRIVADAACNVSNNAIAASATNGIPLASTDKIDLEVTSKNGLFLA